MSHQIISGQELIQALQSQSLAGQDISLAVAFWGAGAPDGLGLTKGRNARIICNLEMGGTNPVVIATLKERGIKVRHHPTLHAKIGIVGDTLSFVGSSNMSANGLGMEGAEQTGWEEVNVLFDHVDPDVQARFDALWSNSLKVTKKDLKAARARWLARRAATVVDDAGADSLWEAIATNSERLQAQPCTIAYFHEMEEDEERDFQAAEREIRAEYGRETTAFQDWDDLPSGYIISACLSRRRKNTIKDVGVSFRQGGGPVHEKDGTTFQVVESRDNLPGFKALKGIDPEQLKSLKSLILSYVDAAKKGGGREKSRLIPLQDLARFYQDTIST